MYLWFGSGFLRCPIFPDKLSSSAKSGIHTSSNFWIKFWCSDDENQVVDPVSTRNWCVINTEGTFLERTPKRLSEMIPHRLYLFTQPLTIFFSAKSASNILGNCCIIFHLNFVASSGYSIWYEGNSKHSKDGNSFFNKASASPSEAIIGVWWFSCNARIMGIQRVAWPNPQFNGATNTAFGYDFGVKNEKVIACKTCNLITKIVSNISLVLPKH